MHWRSLFFIISRCLKPRRGFARNSPQVSRVAACWGLAALKKQMSHAVGLHSCDCHGVKADPFRGSVVGRVLIPQQVASNPPARHIASLVPYLGAITCQSPSGILWLCWSADPLRGSGVWRVPAPPSKSLLTPQHGTSLRSCLTWGLLHANPLRGFCAPFLVEDGGELG